MISQGEECREDVGGGWQHTCQTLEKSPTSKLYTTWAHILSDRNVFAPRGGGKRRGPMPLGHFFFFFGCHLPQTFARSKQYLPVTSFVSSLFARIFMKVGVENYWRFNGIKTSLMKAGTKVLASFEAGMNSPNLPWHVNITSLKHRRRFGEVPCFRQVE